MKQVAIVTKIIVIPVAVSFLYFLLTFFLQLFGYNGIVSAYMIRKKSSAVIIIHRKSN